VDTWNSDVVVIRSALTPHIGELELELERGPVMSAASKPQRAASWVGEMMRYNARVSMPRLHDVAQGLRLQRKVLGNSD
jgi:hypothetical protein